MNFMETMEKMNSIDDVQLKKDWGYTDIQLFSLNEGVFAARKEWQKDPALRCKSVFLSKFTNDEGYRYDQENDTAADILVTGVIPKEYQIYEPTIEDQIADDWAVVTVHNSKVVDKYL